LACKKILIDNEYDKYGVVDGGAIEDSLIEVAKFVEKPGKENAPSDLASVSGYLLTPKIFDYIDKAAENFDGNGELMIQPIMQQMINDGESVYAREIVGGVFYDTGDKLEYLKTVIDFGLSHDTLGEPLREHLVSRLNISGE
jgi:UTP--glucose-1-phosphate uridylyltransferase